MESSSNQQPLGRTVTRSDTGQGHYRNSAGALPQSGRKEFTMLLYYRVDKNKEDDQYIFHLYYKGILGRMVEKHRSVHKEIKDLNEAIQYYRALGHQVQSIATA